MTSTRLRFVAFVSASALLAVAGSVHAQFVQPTCVPPNCSPTVIQNIDVAGTPQTANINITGSGKLGSKFETGAQAPTFTTATDYLFFGNVNGASSAGYLLALQTGGADRYKVNIAGQQQVPLGTVGAPSYSFLTDTNTGLFSSAADSMTFVTNGAARTVINNNGTTISAGVLSLPTGSVGAPSVTFTGDTNTGIYRSAADTLQLVTNGANRLTVDSAGTVTIPGDLVVGGSFNISANSITSGTLSDARLSSNVALLNANQTFTGINNFTNGNNTYNGTYTGVGSALTGLNASQLTSGTVPAARLPSNVALYDANGAFTGSNSFSNMTQFGSPSIVIGGSSNLLYGNVDAASTGALMLLQTESADRFRVSPNGNVAFTGTLTTGTVPWARLGSFPSACSAGQYVSAVGGTLTCSTPTGTGDPSAADDFTGSGTANYVAKFTGSTSLGDSAIYDDGSGNIGLGTTSLGSKLTVYGGSIGVSYGSISSYQVAAGATGVSGQVVGVGSTGVAGNGGSYGVYGSSGGYGVYGYNTSAGASGAGVYGYGTGTSPGIQGDSQSGWGGSFSSLYVTPGSVYFASSSTLNGPATFNNTLRLGNLGSDPGGANGTMYYNTGTNKMRCYEGGAWKDCVSSGGVTSVTGSGAGISVAPTTGAVIVTNTGDTNAADDHTGSGTANTLAKWTGALALGNSIISDNGATVTVAGTLAANTNITVAGVNVCRQNGTNCPPVTEADTLATVTGRGATTATPISVTSGATAISGSGSGAGVYGTAGSNGGIGVQGVMTATGGYGIYGSSSGSGGNGVYGNAGASNGIGVNGLGGYIGVAGAGPYGVYGDGGSSGTYAAGVYGTGYHGVEGYAKNSGYGLYGTGGQYGAYGSGSYMGLYGSGGTYGVYATGSSYAVYAGGNSHTTGTHSVGGNLVAEFNSWGSTSAWFYCELDSASAGWQYCTCPGGSYVMNVAVYNPGGYGVARDIATQCAKP